MGMNGLSGSPESWFPQGRQEFTQFNEDMWAELDDRRQKTIDKNKARAGAVLSSAQAGDDGEGAPITTDPTTGHQTSTKDPNRQSNYGRGYMPRTAGIPGLATWSGPGGQVNERRAGAQAQGVQDQRAQLRQKAQEDQYRSQKRREERYNKNRVTGELRFYTNQVTHEFRKELENLPPGGQSRQEAYGKAIKTVMGDLAKTPAMAAKVMAAAEMATDLPTFEDQIRQRTRGMPLGQAVGGGLAEAGRGGSMDYVGGGAMGPEEQRVVDQKYHAYEMANKLRQFSKSPGVLGDQVRGLHEKGVPMMRGDQGFDAATMDMIREKAGGPKYGGGYPAEVGTERRFIHGGYMGPDGVAQPASPDRMQGPMGPPASLAGPGPQAPAPAAPPQGQPGRPQPLPPTLATPQGPQAPAPAPAQAAPPEDPARTPNPWAQQGGPTPPAPVAPAPIAPAPAPARRPGRGVRPGTLPSQVGRARIGGKPSPPAPPRGGKLTAAHEPKRGPEIRAKAKTAMEKAREIWKRMDKLKEGDSTPAEQAQLDALFGEWRGLKDQESDYMHLLNALGARERWGPDGTPLGSYDQYWSDETSPGRRGL